MLQDELDQPNVISPEKFSVEVEQRFVDEGPSASYIEITAMYLEELGIDADEGKHLISKALLDKIQTEALRRNMLKDKNTTVSLVE